MISSSRVVAVVVIKPAAVVVVVVVVVVALARKLSTLAAVRILPLYTALKASDSIDSILTESSQIPKSRSRVPYATASRRAGSILMSARLS
jgi:hypothetical protein